MKREGEDHHRQRGQRRRRDGVGQVVGPHLRDADTDEGDEGGDHTCKERIVCALNGPLRRRHQCAAAEGGEGERRADEREGAEDRHELHQELPTLEHVRDEERVVDEGICERCCCRANVADSLPGH